MKILVTGGTGFVGSQTVAALLRRGHTVRLLARTPERAAQALAPLGATGAEVVAGDVRDPTAVEAALRGCEAVFNAASVFSFDSRDARTILATNVKGTEIVLDVARRRGADPIVHVSSFVALLPGRGGVLRAEQPVGRPIGVYGRSKADADRVARRHQQAGAPVVISYPGSVWGPDDPHFGESAQLATQILTGQFRLVPGGGIPLVDVRDLAAAHAALFERGRGPRRYLLGGRFVLMTDLVRQILAATGRWRATVRIPAELAVASGFAADLVQRLVPVRIPVNLGGSYAAWCAARSDDSRAAAELGFSPRPLAETVVDTVRWIAKLGRITPRQAGALAPAHP
jgi:nucleoside-diphosphate-sugar epimerase